MAEKETPSPYTFLTLPERIEMVTRAIHQTEANIAAAELDLAANRAIILVIPKGLQDATKKDLETLTLKLVALRAARGVYVSTLSRLEVLNAAAAAKLAAEQEAAARAEAEAEAQKILDFAEAKERLDALREESEDSPSPKE